MHYGGMGYRRLGILVCCLLRLTPSFHWICVCCVAAPIWFCSAVQQSPPVAVRHSTVDSWHHEARSSCDNHIITPDCSYRSVLLKKTTQSVPDQRFSRRACVCLFFESCVLVSTRSVLFWKVNGCCVLFRRLTSYLLNSAELLHHALASARNRSPA